MATGPCAAYIADLRTAYDTRADAMMKHAETTFFSAATIGALALAAVIAVQEIALEPTIVEAVAASPVVRLETAEIVGDRAAVGDHAADHDRLALAR
jgi:hypothetical protein